MNTLQASLNRTQLVREACALGREGDHWRLTFAGQPALFKHELGALYVAYLLLRHPPKEPLHAVALALKAREAAREPAAPDEANEQRQMGLREAELVRGLWRRQRELERMLADRLVIEPVKAEALRELEEVSELLRTSRWLSHDGAGRCVRAVSRAIQRFHSRLLEPVGSQGSPDPVLAEFADHLHRHLLMPSGRGCEGPFRWLAMVPSGFFTYVPPGGVTWKSLESRVLSPESTVHSPQSSPSLDVGCSMLDVGCSNLSARPSSLSPRTSKAPAAMGFLSRFLGMTFALALVATGCVGPRPLKGGKATTTRSQAGLIQQTLAQGENAQQPSKQDQETVKARTYTLPAATRIEQMSAPSALSPQPSTLRGAQDSGLKPQGSSGPSTLPPPQDCYGGQATWYVLSAPMPVVEREETRARTELGAAQKDTGRDLAAKLSSLKGIVWVGVGLFVFGLASLVYPPLKAIVASVTTSAALMLGGWR
jgi:hypothetical protein